MRLREDGQPRWYSRRRAEILSLFTPIYPRQMGSTTLPRLRRPIRSRVEALRARTAGFPRTIAVPRRFARHSNGITPAPLSIRGQAAILLLRARYPPAARSLGR